MSTINYVIAGWTGPRRSDRDPDGSYFLRTHLAVLSRLRHDLSQITVMVPDNPNQSPRVSKFLDSIAGTEMAATPVVVLQRENVGLSYGSFACAYETFRDEFDYYLFIEDDYVFVRDQFDKALIELFHGFPKCGFLCGLTQIWKRQEFAGISNGITTQDVLCHVHQHYGKIPFSENARSRYSSKPQITFTTSISKLGYRIADITGHFKSPYFCPSTQTIRDFAPQQEEYLIVPTQMIASRAFATVAAESDRSGRSGS